MTSTTVNRIKKSHANVPSNKAEAALAIAEIGQAQTELDSIEEETRLAIAKLRAKAKEASAPYASLRDARVNELFAYASGNREELCASGIKTVEFTTGRVLWRMTPPAVATSNDDEVIDRLERLGLEEFVRIKKSLDRKALLAKREEIEDLEIAGLAFAQHEEFVVVPNTSPREVTVTRTID